MARLLLPYVMTSRPIPAVEVFTDSMREAMHKTYRMTSSSQDALAEARLWQAVIVNTIQDWISGPPPV